MVQTFIVFAVFLAVKAWHLQAGPQQRMQIPSAAAVSLCAGFGFLDQPGILPVLLQHTSRKKMNTGVNLIKASNVRLDKNAHVDHFGCANTNNIK